MFCGLTNFAHTLESHVNNRLFFLVQLSDFGKEGRKEGGEKKYIFIYTLCQGTKPWFISLVLTSVCMCRAGPWPPEWTEALTSLLCLGADKEECVRGREPIYASFRYSLYSPRRRHTRSDLKHGATLVWSSYRKVGGKDKILRRRFNTIATLFSLFSLMLSQVISLQTCVLER